MKFPNRNPAKYFDDLVEIILQEGLISSYNIRELQKTLYTKFKNVDVILPTPKNFNDSNFDYHAYTFSVAVKRNIEIDKKEFKKILDLYGYYISNERVEAFFNEIIYTIEPKYPIIINDILEKRHIEKFYHITHKSNQKSIMKIGLAPRGTETTFYHPEDRIYLISAEIEMVKRLLKSLSNDKKQPIESFLVFETPYDNTYKYYLDDTSTFKKYDAIGCFILKNISPNKLKIVSLANNKNLNPMEKDV